MAGAALCEVGSADRERERVKENERMKFDPQKPQTTRLTSPRPSFLPAFLRMARKPRKPKAKRHRSQKPRKPKATKKNNTLPKISRHLEKMRRTKRPNTEYQTKTHTHSEFRTASKHSNLCQKKSAQERGLVGLTNSISIWTLRPGSATRTKNSPKNRGDSQARWPKSLNTCFKT